MIEADIAVLGAGPAGMAAATAAARGGARTVILDEYPKPGGQVYRAPAEGIAPHGPDWEIGEALRDELSTSGAQFLGSCRVWAIAKEPLGALVPEAFRLTVSGPAGAFTAIVRTLILCPGTYERVVPFPGWTLPGVMGLAAGTILVKSQSVLPGRRVVVAGAGPLLGAVGAGLIESGAEVAALIDVASKGAWITAMPGLAVRPSLLFRGINWAKTIISHGVTIVSGSRIAEAFGDEQIRMVAVEAIADGPQRREFYCDALLVGHGLTPATEASRLLGAEHTYRPEYGGWVPVLDDHQRSSVRGLYIAGDGAGVIGAHAAPITGRVAALAALSDIGLTEAFVSLPQQQLRKSRTFAAALSPVWRVPRQLVTTIPSECIVCRCEDVTRGELEAAIDAGARDVNQLKHFTRAGMGPCQGRVCGETVADLLAARVGSRDQVGCFTPRLPLRPVALTRIIGEFCYKDIPIPAPAPI
jgi:NADPH-dependent 2,4-dienoyl-CoA reductase/sulfur reductase-like enzyme